MFKENNDNFNILSYLFCKYFWLEKTMRKKIIQ